MNRHISDVLWIVVLLTCSAASAQTGASAPPAPAGMAAGPALSSSAAQPNWPPPPPAPADASGVPTPPPPGQATWPPPGSPAPPPAAISPVPPPGQPVYPPPGSYVVVPQPQPVYPPPVWLAEPNSGLGLIPGGTNAHWDVSVDALWLERDTGRGVWLGDVGYNHSPAYDQLWSDDELFPLEPGVRLQLVGRVTDRMTIEGTAWGLQHWSVGRTIYPDPGALATSSWLQSYFFDNSLGYTYTSDVANVELNQRFKLFSFDPYRALSWLWGVRYFYLSDDLALHGSDLFTSTEEDLSWRTKNNLLGAQLGLQWSWGWDRFQLSAEGKVGLFANAYSQQGTDSINGSISSPGFDVSHSGTDLAALCELSFLARFRINEWSWLRLGYQYYCVTGLATGPRQLGGFDNGGSIGLDGLSLGLEFIR